MRTLRFVKGVHRLDHSSSRKVVVIKNYNRFFL